MAALMRDARGSAAPELLVAAVIMAAAWALIVAFGSVAAPERSPAREEVRP